MTQCVICLDRAANFKLKPCNHDAFCDTCLFKLLERDRKSGCPLCRSHVFYMRSTTDTDSDDEAAEYWAEMAANDEWRNDVGADCGFDDPDAFGAFARAQAELYGALRRRKTGVPVK